MATVKEFRSKNLLLPENNNEIFKAKWNWFFKNKSDLKVKNDQQIDDNNGKILFSDFKTDKSECSSQGLKAKKRRVDSDDSDSDSSSSSSDSDQSDDDLDLSNESD